MFYKHIFDIFINQMIEFHKPYKFTHLLTQLLTGGNEESNQNPLLKLQTSVYILLIFHL